MSEIPPSEEAPVYGKVQHEDGNLFMITCDEGWRSTVLCDAMYEADADWLLAVLGRRPRRVTPAGELPDEAVRALGLARDEITALRNRCGRLLGEFGRGSDGYRARLSGVVLAREYHDAGLQVPDRLAHLEGQ
jgi:hypothetical protein